MSDRVFSGRDVTEALGMAAQALGLPPERLRYVVLDVGTTGGLGLKPTPARVAVLLGRTPGAVASAPDPGPAAPRASDAVPAVVERPEPESDPSDRIDGVVTALALAARIDVRARVQSTTEAVTVELIGTDVASFLLGASEPSVGEALEHLLHGMFAHRIAPRRLRVACAGQREEREGKLRAKAHELAEAVLKDGRPRETDALNAYERRLVHMAVAERPGLITYSVGGGADRRVTVAPEKVSLGGEVY